MFNRKKEKLMKNKVESEVKQVPPRANKAVMGRRRESQIQDIEEDFEDDNIKDTVQAVENRVTEPTRLFGNEDNLENPVSSLEDYLFNYDNIFIVYDSIVNDGLNSEDYLNLVDDINEAIRTGVILDDTISSRVTPNSLATHFYKAVCAAMEDERKIEVEELNGVAEELQGKLDSVLAELDKAGNSADLQDSMAELENRYNTLKGRYNDIIDENNNLNTKVVELENQLETIVPDNENIMQIQHLNSVIEKLKSSKDRVENEKLELELQLDTISKELSNVRSSVEEYKEENANLALQLEEVKEANNQHAEGDEDFEKRIKELADKLGAKEIELIEANSTIRTLESEINKKKRELLMIPDSSSIIKKLEEALDMVSKENRELVEENISLLATNKSLESKIAQTETVNNNLEVLIEGYKRRLDLGERPAVIPTPVEEKAEAVIAEPVEEKEVTSVTDKDILVEEITDEPLEEVRTYDDSEMVRMFALGMEYRVLAQKLKPEFKTKHSEVGILILENIDRIHEFNSNKEFLISLIEDRLA